MGMHVVLTPLRLQVNRAMLQVMDTVSSHDYSNSLNGRQVAVVPTEVTDGHEGVDVSTDEDDLGRFTLHVVVTRLSTNDWEQRQHKGVQNSRLTLNRRTTMLDAIAEQVQQRQCAAISPASTTRTRSTGRWWID